MPEFHEVHCTGCGLHLAPEFFGKHAGRENGLQPWCNYCRSAHRMAHREVENVRNRKWRAANPDRNREMNKRSNDRNNTRCKLLRRYGLTIAQYDEMLASQDGVCAICHRVCNSGRRLSVDHNHSTGAVRGLLCGLCNKGLGSFRDDPSLMREAARYVER